MNDELVEQLAGRRGHFLTESGFHCEWWFELDGLFEHRKRLCPFVRKLAARLSVYQVEAVCGPMTGGAKLAELLAAELGAAYHFAERYEQPNAKGFFPVRYVVPDNQRAALKGKRVAIVDDAVSAGSAVRGTHADLLACGAAPVAWGALFIFGDAARQFATERGLALECIAPMPVGVWRPDECPLCRAGEPLEKIV